MAKSKKQSLFQLYNILLKLKILGIYLTLNKLYFLKFPKIYLFNYVKFSSKKQILKMISCLMCNRQTHNDILAFKPHKQSQKGGNNFSLIDSNKIKDIHMLMKDNDGRYVVFCSEKCFLDKILTMSTVKTYIKEKYALIFLKSQINSGIIQQMSTLNNLIQQGISLTQNVYSHTNSFKSDEFQIQISLSIQNVINNFNNKFIQHLDEAIKFSMLQTEKVNIIKLQVEKLLNEQGNLNLLDNKAHLNLYEEDIRKYKVDEMIQLMEKIQQVTKQINQTLSPNMG
ncbi:hypothetical protein pb186bvf_000361 [Paramecium bursaria]